MAAAIAAATMATGAAAVADSNWTSAGHDIRNTRFQSAESKIGVDTVARLGPKWVFLTGGDVSATPAVDGSQVYVPDWAGNLYAVDRKTGKQVWSLKISDVTGVPFDKARATPAVSGDKVIVGTQGSILVPGGAPGGKVFAVDKNTGAVRWVTTVDDHPAAIVTQSVTVHGGRVFVGVASMEEALAGFVPGYPCCSFRGSMLALDVATGAILWKTYLAPSGYSGNAVWGSSPAVDVKRGQVYVASGNNYSIPPAAQQCVKDAGANNDAVKACLAADDHFDSIVALDVATGAVRWATRALPFDAWTVACFPFLGDGSNCPEPAGPDYDFGQAPALFTVKSGDVGKPRELVGAGQKSGQYWALDPDSGAVVWVTEAGPGGTGGGLQWGSAVDGRRVYTANSNSNLKPWTLPDGSITSRGVWTALDASTGQVVWQKTPPNADVGGWGETSGPVTTANGVMFSCSVGPAGYMYALDAANGDVLWTFASGGSCLSGAAISNGEVYWGSGYSNFGFGVANNKLYAFELK
jgi:polyvinyl alcohol dehydrogenase (cytochrome)